MPATRTKASIHCLVKAAGRTLKPTVSYRTALARCQGCLQQFTATADEREHVKVSVSRPCPSSRRVQPRALTWHMLLFRCWCPCPGCCHQATSRGQCKNAVKGNAEAIVGHALGSVNQIRLASVFPVSHPRGRPRPKPHRTGRPLSAPD